YIFFGLRDGHAAWSIQKWEEYMQSQIRRPTLMTMTCLTALSALLVGTGARSMTPKTIAKGQDKKMEVRKDKLAGKKLSAGCVNQQVYSTKQYEGCEVTIRDLGRFEIDPSKLSPLGCNEY